MGNTENLHKMPKLTYLIIRAGKEVSSMYVKQVGLINVFISNVKVVVVNKSICTKIYVW